MRPQTTVATQGLFLLNDSSVMNAATATARRLLAGHEDACATATVGELFAWIAHDEPTDAERVALLEFIQGMQAQLAAEGAEDARLRAWALACHALFASSRFQILE
jgi:hypothetical protein